MLIIIPYGKRRKGKCFLPLEAKTAHENPVTEMMSERLCERYQHEHGRQVMERKRNKWWGKRRWINPGRLSRHEASSMIKMYLSQTAESHDNPEREKGKWERRGKRTVVMIASRRSRERSWVCDSVRRERQSRSRSQDRGKWRQGKRRKSEGKGRRKLTIGKERSGWRPERLRTALFSREGKKD